MESKDLYGVARNLSDIDHTKYWWEGKQAVKHLLHADSSVGHPADDREPAHVMKILGKRQYDSDTALRNPSTRTSFKGTGTKMTLNERGALRNKT